MAEGMTDVQIMLQERMNTGTTWTKHDKFDKDGYFVIKDKHYKTMLIEMPVKSL